MTEDVHRSFGRFAGWLKHLILGSSSVDEAVALARFYGALHHANFHGRYFDDEVEQHVQALSMAGPGIDLAAVRQGAGDGVVLVASELYDHGGHTAVALKWLQCRPLGLPHKLLVTRSITEGARRQALAAGAELAVCANYDARAIACLVEHCRGAGTVVLHIHPEDIVAAVGARILRAAGYRVIFYNHADHCFSFGIRAADLVAEIGGYGQELSARTGRTPHASCWLGIPVDVPPMRPPTAAAGSRIVMASGAAPKFKPSAGLFFGDFIDRLLALDPAATVWLVGPSGQESWWRDHADRWGSRMVFKGAVGRSEYFALLDAAQVVVDSFPVGGGTAFPEAVLSGKLCTGLTLPMRGYGPDSELRVATVGELAARVQLLLAGSAPLLAQARSVRQTVIGTLGLAAFSARLEAIYRGTFEGCTNPFEGGPSQDTGWFEVQWARRGVINVPADVLLELPPRLRVLVLLRLLRHVRHLPVGQVLRDKAMLAFARRFRTAGS